jgi:hypothetical protein
MKTAIEMIPFQFAENTKYFNRIIVYFYKKYNKFVLLVILWRFRGKFIQKYLL